MCGSTREHVEADAVHEQVVRTDVVGDLVAENRSWIATWCSASGHRDLVEDRLADHLMECWTTGRTSLRRPLI